MNRLKELRFVTPYSLRDLNEMSGISYSTLSEFESGKRKMSVQHARKLAPIFNVSIDYILGTDAINYVESFSEGLKNLIDSFLPDTMDSATGEKLDDTTRLRYIICENILNSNVTTSELETVNSILNNYILKGDNNE